MEQTKTMVRAYFIYRAIENGWTVRKSRGIRNGFEFTNSSEPSMRSNNNEIITRRRCISAPLVVSLNS